MDRMNCLFQAGRIKMKDLTMPELIGLIDATLACLVRFFPLEFPVFVLKMTCYLIKMLILKLQ